MKNICEYSSIELHQLTCHFQQRRIHGTSGTIQELPQTTESSDVPMTHSITTEKMTSEKVETDTFKPPHHKLKQHIETRLTALLKEYDSQFAQDETSI